MTLTEWLTKPPPTGAIAKVRRESGLSNSALYSILHYGAVPTYENGIRLRDALAAHGCDLTLDALMAELRERATAYAAAKAERAAS